MLAFKELTCVRLFWLRLSFTFCGSNLVEPICSSLVWCSHEAGVTQ